MEQHIGIQDLPIELLVYIFRLSFDITTLQQDRCRLSLVCHSWRDLVQKSPYLWTEISAHDNSRYIETSLAKSKDLPIDIYYLFSDAFRLPTRLSELVDIVTPLLSRSRSISLITEFDGLLWFPWVFVALQSKPALHLESLLLKEQHSQGRGCRARHNLPQLPDMSAFPKLRRLEIDGVPCTLPPRGLGLHNVLSLNLVDVVGVSAEQLLDVLRNSPSLESLELGRSPVICPAHTALTPIHLPHLTTLHLTFMAVSASNFFLSTIHAPNCSELSISSNFAQLPDPNVVRGSLFTTSTNHFTPILRTFLTRGRYKDFFITPYGAGKIQFLLQFHDWDRGWPVASSYAIRLEFILNSTQIEETVRWLGDCLQRNGPKISIRLRLEGFKDIHIMDLLDSYTTITHLCLASPNPKYNSSSAPYDSILVHMAQPTQLGWPLTNLEVFVYGSRDNAVFQDREMLNMLRRRYTSSSEGPDNEGARPRPIRRFLLTAPACLVRKYHAIVPVNKHVQRDGSVLEPDASPINSPPTVTLAARINRLLGAQLMERTTSIQDLPVELLTYIFRLSFDITSLQRDRCRLSLVCHSWRDLVQESAYLWTEISAHDKIQYRERSLAKSKDLSIDIYYLFPYGPRPRTGLSSFIKQVVTPLLRRSRSIFLTTQLERNSFPPLFIELQSKSALRLESLILEGRPGFMDYSYGQLGPNPPQLPDMSAFPKLRRLQIDGIACKLSPRGLGLRNVLSLKLMNVLGVSAEQLLEVLRNVNSPHLESLELGRKPVTCPVQPALTQIHLPHLTTLHLSFMAVPVSNFFLSTIHAPNCSELSIRGADFPPLPDDAVRGSLFTSSTNHFTPVLRTLLTRGRYKDIEITPLGSRGRFVLKFHDWERGWPKSHAIQLDFSLNPTQMEEAVRWLGEYLPRDLPEISIRLRMNRFEDVHIMNLLDSYTTITHFGIQVPSNPGPIMSNSILVQMAQPTQLRWPLTNLEVFVYGAPKDPKPHDEAMLDMLRRRYMSMAEEPENERIRPGPIRKVVIADHDGRCERILREVKKILPEVETPVGDYKDYWGGNGGSKRNLAADILCNKS